MVIKQEEFDISKFTIEEVEGKNFKNAWFNYDGKLPIIEVEVEHIPICLMERGFTH